MNEKMFTSPTLSKKLEQLGIVSALTTTGDDLRQFHQYWWLSWIDEVNHDKGWDLGNHIDVGNNKDGIARGYPSRYEQVQKAYHFSDILLPEQAVKIWGGNIWLEKVNALLYFIHTNMEDWNSWLEAEVDQALNSSNQK